YFAEEILQQRVGILERVRLGLPAIRTMPVVARRRPFLEARACGCDLMGVIETDQPRTIRRMERQRIGQSMRPSFTPRDLSDLESDPIALFEMMNAPVEGQQEF